MSATGLRDGGRPSDAARGRHDVGPRESRAAQTDVRTRRPAERSGRSDAGPTLRPRPPARGLGRQRGAPVAPDSRRPESQTVSLSEAPGSACDLVSR